MNERINIQLPVGKKGKFSKWRAKHRAISAFIRNPLSITGLLIVLVFLIIAIISPYIIPYPVDTTGRVHTAQRLEPPSKAHFFGTDDMGRDIYSRVLAGTRVSLEIGLIIVLVATLIGVPLGLAAGFFGGWLEEIIMRMTDIFLAVPGIVLAIAIVAALGPGITNAMIALSITWWPGYVRLVHGRAKAVKKETFIEASRAIGTSNTRIIFKHVLPNSFSPVLVKMSMDVGMAILFAAALGFIGIGAQPPTPEWGAMISGGQRYLPNWWWYAVFPGLAIWFTVLGFNLLGDGLRDVLDPRSQARHYL